MSHTGPWGSVLWDHLNEIRVLRIKRKSWKDIASQLKIEHGIEVQPRTVRNFFVRSRSPKLKIPAGLDALKSIVKPSTNLVQSSSSTLPITPTTFEPDLSVEPDHKTLFGRKKFDE
jgi:hypothetical protein